MSVWSRYIEGWKEIGRRREAQCRARRLEAWAIVGKLASALTSIYGAHRVWVFGSLTTGGFGLDSDIDLAVEGLPRTSLFKAGAAIERLAEKFQVDLIPLEDADPLLRERVIREGVEVTRGG